jgi:hypothetical protein
MRTFFKLLLNFLEVIFLGPFGLMKRYNPPPPKVHQPDLTEQLLRAKQMDLDAEARKKPADTDHP